MQKLRVPSLLSFETNSSEEGHNSKECDKPLTEEFLSTIICRRCGESGHLGADCPEKPKFVCNNCGREGHKRSECTVSQSYSQTDLIGTSQFGQRPMQRV
jgi:Zinc knuckle